MDGLVEAVAEALENGQRLPAEVGLLKVGLTELEAADTEPVRVRPVRPLDESQPLERAEDPEHGCFRQSRAAREVVERRLAV